MDTKSKNRHKLGIVLILGVILLATVIVLGNYNTFYKNAKKSILTNNQFYFDARHVYANAKKKLPCLKRLPELTKKCKLANPVVQHIFSLSPDVYTKHILIPLDASFLF